MKKFIRAFALLTLIIFMTTGKAAARKYAKPFSLRMQSGLLFNGLFVTSFSGTQVSLQLINNNGIVQGCSGEDRQVLKGKVINGKLSGTIIKQVMPIQFEAYYVNDKLLFYFNKTDVALVRLWMNINGEVNNKFPSELFFTQVTTNNKTANDMDAAARHINPLLQGTWVYKKCMPGIINTVSNTATEAITISGDGKLSIAGYYNKRGLEKNKPTVVEIYSKNNTVYVNNHGQSIPVFTFTMYGSKMVTVIISSGKKQCWIKK